MSLIEAARTGGSADVLRTLRTVCDARGLDGLAQRLADLGDLLLETITDYCQAQQLETDQLAEAPIARPKREAKISLAKQEAFRLFAQGVGVEEVAQALARARSTTTTAHPAAAAHHPPR